MMRVLWVVNTVFPDAARKLGISPPVVGGWMYGLAADLSLDRSILLAVATVYHGKELLNFEVDGIRYYLIPQGAKNHARDSLTKSWRTVASDFEPDLVHIHGTEYGHGMALMDTCLDLKYVVSIQGLVSVCYRYFMAGLTVWDALRNAKPWQFLKGSTLLHVRHSFRKQGIVEKEYVDRATAVIGRTDWDRSHVEAMNPGVRYCFCNESLRDEFYTDDRWSLDSCRRYSIFLSQAGTPIKGLHQVLKALALLGDEFPEIVVNVAGPDITSSSAPLARFRRSGYGRYIHGLIKRFGLEGKVRFLGPMRADEMRQAYLSAHVFICPSSIENSPNSLGEAQILGVPCIASYCGGVPYMVRDGETALLYRFEEHEMLASRIRTLFYSDETAGSLSKSGLAEALSRHDRRVNADALKSIYQDVVLSPIKGSVGYPA